MAGETAAEPWRTCCGCRLLNLAAPTQYEAFWITMLSLAASITFWVASFEAIRSSTSASTAGTMLESLFDVISTFAVLYRFYQPDALASSAANARKESCAAVALALTLVALGVIMSAFALAAIADGGALTESRAQVEVEVMLTLPATIVYVVIGLLQLQMGWTFRSKSMQMDGMVSIFGSALAFGGLFATQVEIFESKKSTFFGRSLKKAVWLDPALTILTACVMCAYGVHELRAEVASTGAAWWRLDFWSGGGAAPSQQPGADSEGGGAAKGGASPTESTPLRK